MGVSHLDVVLILVNQQGNYSFTVYVLCKDLIYAGILTKGELQCQVLYINSVHSVGSLKVISNTSDRLIESWVSGYFEPVVASCVSQYTVFSDTLSAFACALVSKSLHLLVATPALDILQLFRAFACNYILVRTLHLLGKKIFLHSGDSVSTARV
jgi:hypothetical protein